MSEGRQKASAACASVDALLARSRPRQLAMPGLMLASARRPTTAPCRVPYLPVWAQRGRFLAWLNVFSSAPPGDRSFIMLGLSGHAGRLDGHLRKNVDIFNFSAFPAPWAVLRPGI